MNGPLLRAVRDKILMEPRRHQQSSWATVTKGNVRTGVLVDGYFHPVTCGTTGCVAGWAVQLAGDELLVGSGEYHYLGNRRRAVVRDCLTPDGDVRRIGHRAAELLGLDDMTAGDLFKGFNTRQEVLDQLDLLIKRADEEEIEK